MTETLGPIGLIPSYQCIPHLLLLDRELECIDRLVYLDETVPWLPSGDLYQPQVVCIEKLLDPPFVGKELLAEFMEGPADDHEVIRVSGLGDHKKLVNEVLSGLLSNRQSRTAAACCLDRILPALSTVSCPKSA